MNSTSADWRHAGVTESVCDHAVAPRAVRLFESWYGGLSWALLLTLVIGTLWFIPGRTGIAPLVEQDNAYIFLAVDRLCSGEGLTSLPPKAPFQPWTWRSDWAVLTQWPAGYPLLIAFTRTLLGVTTVQAAIALNVAFCGIALVAWFALIRVCLPRGIASGVLALAAAASSVSMGHLVNPSSDTLLLAMTPVVMLLTFTLLIQGRTGVTKCLLVGIVAGSLVWIRYSAIFLPAAIGAFLLFDWAVMRRRFLRDAVLFGAAAALPMLGLVIFNRAMGDQVSTQEQFNLGNRFGFDFSFSMIAVAWERFSTQTLYAHRAESTRVFSAVIPLIAIALPMMFASSRRRYLGWLKSEQVQLIGMCVIAMVTVLVTASTLFKGKFDYVELARYYDPIKPIYFVLFVGPLVLLQRKVARSVVTIGAVFALSWFVQQDGMRTRERWLAADRPFTSYGRWDHRFGSNSGELYGWLANQAGSETVIFSNFHDDIALETGLPISPMPESLADLEGWLSSIRKSRRVKGLRVLFVLEFKDDSRDYFQPRPEGSIRTLGLVPAKNAPESIKNHVFEMNSVGTIQISSSR